MHCHAKHNLWPAVTDVPWSVCVLLTIVNHAKTSEPIEVPFEVQTWVGPRNHVLGEGPDPTGERAIFLGGRRCYLQNIQHAVNMLNLIQYMPMPSVL